MHRGDTQITLRWLQPVRRNDWHLDAKDAIFTPPQGFDRRCARPCEWRSDWGGSVQFHWRCLNGFLSRCLWRCCFTSQVVQDFFHSTISWYQQTPQILHQGTRTGVPLYCIPMVFSWCSRMEFLGMTINTTIYRAYIGISHRGPTLGSGYIQIIPLILWKR